jgi:hypothetical protein
MSYSIFSQGLKPTVQHIDSNIFFCFTINQSKEIGKRIASGISKDSIATRLEIESSRLFLVTQKQDITISLLENKIDNLGTINQNQEINIGLLNNTIKGQKQKIKRSRFHKVLLGIGLGVMTAIAISK